jgi:F-type H+-transporting ATPase subunit b
MAPLLAAGLLDIEPGLIFWTLITFGLLYFFLRWKVFGPILKATEEREKSIRAAVEEGRRQREEAEKLLAEQKKLLGDARRESAEMLKAAMAQAEKAKVEMMANARKEAEDVVAQAKRQIEDERKRAEAQLRGMVVDLALEATEKLLGETLKDPARQKALIEQYILDFEKRPRA